MSIQICEFGKTSKGELVHTASVTNAAGASMTVMDLGAILVGVCVPGKDGKLVDVALGFDTVAGYEADTCFLGQTVGRSGNRICGGSFVIDGKSYQLDKNENDNNLHSGFAYYSQRIWEMKTLPDENAVAFHLVSPDGDQGYPGTADITVTYRLTDENAVEIAYSVDVDAATIVNLTNHSYWNLNGHHAGSIMKHTMAIHASHYLPVDEVSIPLGDPAPVEGTPFDFRAGKTIGQDADADDIQLAHTGGFDHHFCVDGQGMREMACVKGDESGIVMRVFSDLPGIQFYAGNFLADENVKGGGSYGKHEGFALESQYEPDSVNRKNAASPVVPAGSHVETKTVYAFEI